MSRVLHGMPMNTLPDAGELQLDDQVIAYRADTGQAYRSAVGGLAESAAHDIGEAFDTSKSYSAGDYCIYNDTLYVFTADKTAGSWNSSVVQATTVVDEIAKKQNTIEDSGWQTLTLASTFVAYSTASTPKYRKIGNMVQVVGAIAPRSSGTGSTTNITFGALPEGYRPSQEIDILCQGSQRTKWNMRITTAGECSFARYSDDNGWASYSTSSWLPFNVTYYTD